MLPVIFKAIMIARSQIAWKPGTVLLAALLLLASTASSALGQEPSPAYDPNNVTVPGQPPAALLGEGLFQQNCAPCHGQTGGGDGEVTAEMPVTPTAFSDPAAVWDLSPAEFFHVTKFGRIEQMMPPWQARMTDEQIWQTVFFAWQLQTSEAEVNQGGERYVAECAACHGLQGAGDGPESSGNLPDFSDLEAMMLLSQSSLEQGWAEAHPELGAAWSEPERASVLSYIRTFTYNPSWESPLGSGPGTIQGTIAQASPGGDPFAGGDVSLEVYAHMTPLDTVVSTVGEDGRFSFDGLPVDPGIFYLVVTEYKGIRYSSPVLRFGVDDSAASTEVDNTLEAEISIYETTDDPSGVRVSQMSWIIEHEPGALLLGQVVSFANSDDYTFAGQTIEGVDVPVTLSLTLPDGAQEIGFQDGSLGGVYRQVGNVVYDTRPVPPGQSTRQIFVRYRLPYEGHAATVEQPLTYALDGFNLLVADLPNLQVEAAAAESSLAFGGEQAIQGLTYLQWTATALAPQTITLQLSGLIGAGEQDPRLQGPPGTAPAQVVGTGAITPALDPLIPLAMGGVLLLALIGVGVWRWRAGMADAAGDELSVEEERAELIQQIADIDDLHAEGELDNERWQAQRAALKRRLYALTVPESDRAGE